MRKLEGIGSSSLDSSELELDSSELYSAAAQMDCVRGPGIRQRVDADWQEWKRGGWVPREKLSENARRDGVTSLASERLHRCLRY